jgi:hypothetical protein
MWWQNEVDVIDLDMNVVATWQGMVVKDIHRDTSVAVNACSKGFSQLHSQ